MIRALAILGLTVSMAASAGDGGNGGNGGGAAALRAKHDEYREHLAKNGFGKPIHLVSSEANGKLKGDVYAVVNHAFATVSQGFGEAASWCEVLILPFNTKHCYAAKGEGDSVIAVRIARKSSQPAEEAYALNLKYHVDARSADYMRVTLHSDQGPVGTRDYNIALEATPIDDNHSFLHLAYSYGSGGMSQLMMQTYLSTTGANKVGFTVNGKDDQGKPAYVGGMRGAVERNAMRYYLAIEAYLASLSAGGESGRQKRLSDWFAATERYPAQLHEMDRNEYLAMKKRDTEKLNRPLS